MVLSVLSKRAIAAIAFIASAMFMSCDDAENVTATDDTAKVTISGNITSESLPLKGAIVNYYGTGSSSFYGDCTTDSLGNYN